LLLLNVLKKFYELEIYYMNYSILKKKSIKIFTDNSVSKTSIENDELNNKLKHIEIKILLQ